MGPYKYIGTQGADREAETGLFSAIIPFLMTAIFTPAPKDPGVLGSLTPHWILLSLILGLLAYISSIDRTVFSSMAKADAKGKKKIKIANDAVKAVKQDAKEKLKTTKKVRNDRISRHWADLYALRIVEFILIALSIITLLRIIVPLFEVHAGDISKGLTWLTMALGLGAVVLLVILLMSLCDSDTGIRIRYVWLSALIAFFTAGAVVFVVRMKSWPCCLWTPTLANVDAFILAGFFVAVCFLSLLFLRQAWIYRESPRRKREEYPEFD